MNEALQFGPHPDADQINAFVEHALPAHEQAQMLDHLSVCQECRTIVALSIPPVESPSVAFVVPARRPWWSGWNLAWPATAAVTALAIFLITFHHHVIAPTAPQPSQSAASHPPALPVTAGHPSATLEVQSNKNPAARSKHDRIGTSGSEPQVSTQQNTKAMIAQKQISELPLKGRNVGAVGQLAQAPPSAAPEISSQNGTAGVGLEAGSSAGAEVSFGAASQVPAVKAAAPKRPAAAPQAPGQASETVAVSSAASSIETENHRMGAIPMASPQAEVVPLKHRLPSKLPVLSVAAEGLRMVAIDTRNAVFASQDGGRHWKPVQPQWPGRAVTAVLVNFPIMNEARNAVNDALVAPVPQTSTSAPVANNLPRFTAAGRPALAGSLTGTVTDRSGAVIRGASVTIRDPATHATRTVTTDSAGRYQIEGLTPGAEQSEVQVEVQARGFQKQTLASVAIRTDSANVANVSLAVGAASQSVEVSSAGPAIETTPTPLPDQNSSGTSKKELAPSGASLPAPALFEITTDNGDRWTSPDGVTWKQR